MSAPAVEMSVTCWPVSHGLFVVVDEAHHLFVQIDQAVEATALEYALLQQAEPQLDLIEP